MSIGTQIIEEVIKQSMFRVSHPDPDAGHVFVWSSGAAEQLEALVHESADVQIPRRTMLLFGDVLQLLGAPDGGNPAELLAWAEVAAKKLKYTP